jgi:hypothetical protein
MLPELFIFFTFTVISYFYISKILNPISRVEIKVKRKVGDILPFLTQEDLLMKWSSGMQYSSPLNISPDEIKIGMKLFQVFNVMNMESKMTLEVINFEKDTILQFKVDSEDTDEKLTYNFLKISENETRIQMVTVFRLKKLIYNLATPAVMFFLHRKLEKDFKKLAEFLNE